jgi:sugar lactone lactonase YvrE
MQIEAFAGCCNPCRFALLPNGGFVTAEKGMVRVKIYNEKGKLESVVAPPDDFNTGTPWVDVAADAAGAIYILDPERSQIRVYNRKAAMG